MAIDFLLSHQPPPLSNRTLTQVCAVVTEEFLNYSRAQGNDLITPRPEYRFPGLKSGDRWCLCASRWQVRFRVDGWFVCFGG